MSYHERRLPHWDPGNSDVFLTWRLHGTLPTPEPEWDRLPAGKHFAAEDRAMDRSTGPHFLKDPRVADAVAQTLFYAADTLHLYDLHAWVIMPNHVHILIHPKAPLSKITSTIKGYSARQANSILERTGQPFWQIESYDHCVRDEKEFGNIIRYVEYNPVAAGLVATPEDWKWSSAGLEARATRSEP
jgi:REP element-mobilizing transposase RayT